MSTKAVVQLVFCALVFAMCTTINLLVTCEEDCYIEKERVKSVCKESIARSGPYVSPVHNPACIEAVRESDMACICNILTEEDEEEISPLKLVRLAREYHRPLGTRCGSE
ncbi:hypothetical protein BS78_02G032400 [Paspalum vaginatum]|nr:hypothetical protein BS78_02G032400 [Paspalum vaginatum]